MSNCGPSVKPGRRIAIVTVGILNPIVGWRVDRENVRRLLGPGGLLSCRGLLLVSRVRSFMLFGTVFGLMVGGGSCLFERMA